MPDDPCRIIVSEPGYLVATIEKVDSGTALVEYRSVIVKTHGELYQPVRGFLGSHCSTVLSEETLSDPDMKFQKAVLTVRQIWEVCPGNGPHVCVAVPKPREDNDGELDRPGALGSLRVADSRT